jgi:hypothetical protein
MFANRIVFAICLVPVALLAGCGKSADKTKAAAAPAEYGVFISTLDCADTGKLKMEECSKLIDHAVALHNKETTVYKFLQKCEAGEGGPDRCDKTGEDEYRAKLQAFYITFSTPPVAIPLYPPRTASLAFRTQAKQVVDVRDASLLISNDAKAVAHENTKLQGAR